MALNLSQKIGALTTVTPGDQFGTNVRKTSIAQASTPGANLRCRISSSPGERDQLTPPLSPCRSPLRTDLDVACRALTADPTAEAFPDVEEKKHLVEMPKGDGVPVYVMLPLDTVRPDGTLNRKKAMWASLMGLKKAGVEGVMVDVWWGLVEKDGPAAYNWSGYTDLMEMAKQVGLKVQAVMSFHQCGGNVGDSVTIPLPRWVVEEMERDPDLCYSDQWGRRNYEYVSLGCDTLPVLKGRTPVQCYADFMRAFRDQFQSYLGTTIVEIQVGMGPAGELRYPSYPESDGTWKFPGIGAFQCYDKYMKSSLKAAALSAGKPDWGHGGPTDAGGYNSWPEDTAFFCKEGGGWNGPYGEFFLSWYSQMLLDHGERILSAAFSIFSDCSGVKISVKVAGIHWHYGTRSHAAELTAGYYNTRFRDGYLPIARMLARHGAVFNFTCLEMRDCEQPGDACCRPEALVKQVAAAAKEAGVRLAGENALPRYDESAHEQVVNAAASGDQDDNMVAFTYLRLNPQLFEYDNWRKFVAFVEQMRSGKDRSREVLERKAEQFVQATSPLVQEAGVALMSG